MAAEQTRPGHSEPPSRETVALWFGFLAGPVALLWGQMIVYALVPDACDRKSSVWVHVVHLIIVLVSLLGGWMALRVWRRLGRGEADSHPSPEHRARFMAVSGMAIGAFFALTAAAMWLATFLLSPCSA